MNIAICDDEENIRIYIRKLIQKQEPFCKITEFSSGKELLEFQDETNAEEIDILFLDISMGDEDGMTVAKQLRSQMESKKEAVWGSLPLLIFVTGYPEYMQEAFSVNAFQYIVKPIQSIFRGLDVLSEEYIFRVYLGMAIGMGILLLSYTLVFLIMTGVVIKIVKKPFMLRWQETIFLSVLNIVGSMIVGISVDLSVVQIEGGVFLLYDDKQEMLWKLPIIAVLIYVGEISAIYIYQNYRKLQKERQKHFVEEQQVKAMKQRLEEAENFYGSIRRVRHEMKNHMTNIKGLVASEKYDEVENYIEKLDETIQTMDYKFNTGNAVTDVIINDKYQKAENAGISFQVKFNLGETDTISAFDIGIILNNLLDNAIEACEKLEQEQRYINLTLKKKNHFLLIEVENSFDGKVIWEDGGIVPMTTKQSDLPDILMEHGIGLKNVKDVADHYLGDMDIKIKNDVFKVTVMLQQKEIN